MLKYYNRRYIAFTFNPLFEIQEWIELWSNLIKVLKLSILFLRFEEWIKIYESMSKVLKLSILFLRFLTCSVDTTLACELRDLSILFLRFPERWRAMARIRHLSRYFQSSF